MADMREFRKALGTVNVVHGDEAAVRGFAQILHGEMMAWQNSILPHAVTKKILAVANAASDLANFMDGRLSSEIDPPRRPQTTLLKPKTGGET